MSVRARLASLPLRVRLVLVVVLLTAAGLAVAGVATRYALERFLVDRLDQQIASAEQPLVLALAGGGPGGPRGLDGLLPEGSYATVLPSTGASVYVGRAGQASDELKRAAGSAPFGRSSDGGYRFDVVRLRGDPDGDQGSLSGSRLVVAVPLSDVHSTLDRLALLELLIGLAVLAAVAAAAYLLVRHELRPLRRIEDTAAAIAAGDLTQRVAEADPRTEVGSLGRSLNAMLAQIEQAFDERRRSEQRLRRFVADASHELRTPLTSVRGFAELFRRGAAERPDDLALVMARIEAEAERMGVLVEDLLLLARLDSGRPLDVVEVDPAAIAAELAEDALLLHSDRPLELRADGDCRVQADPLRLRQAIVNLLANARQHTPEGTPIDLTVQRRGDDVVIEVADRGPGLGDAADGRLFERFYRADPSRARASGGAGLGLSITAAILEAHGGSVEAADREGGGAVFRLALPAAARPARPAAAGQAGEAAQP